ncbi:IMP dehydrogenase [Bartonella sp. DGB1]|uniref:IMP dehydrogenase n=1 Tax=Bartonella sp. DGB1 TaxID=3239807 RepID=UPI003525D1C8
MAKISEHLALTFDDVLLEPAHSEILPTQVDITTFIGKNIELKLPILSAAMDTVTESSLAIAVAQMGGIGVIHRNLSIKQQAHEVRRVKRFESGMVLNPITATPDMTLGQARQLMKKHGITGIPVVEQPQQGSEIGRLVGILTNRDVRFIVDETLPISQLMTCKNLVTARSDVSPEKAKELLQQHRIEKLLITDNNGNFAGLITVKDIEQAQLNPLATKDAQGRLRVGAAINVGSDGIARAEALMQEGVDLLVVDTAHGHSQRVLEAVKTIKQMANENICIMAGNIATAEAAHALIEAGADAIKVGIGPGSICTTRIVAGVGVPQLSAIMDVVSVARSKNIAVIADGGIKSSGDFAKAMAAGAQAIMIGSVLAGTDESPGEVYMYQGRAYKAYRGMGSVGAMARGSADRYFQGEVRDELKLVPEGVEGQVAYKGPVSGVLHQLAGGLKASMGYTGSKNLLDFYDRAKFIRITNAGLKESHIHDISITRESPNYSV